MPKVVPLSRLAWCLLALALWGAPAEAHVLEAPEVLTRSVLAKRRARKAKPKRPAQEPESAETRAATAEPPASAGAGAPKSEASAEGVARAPRGPTRIDFDDRLIQGQTNKSGAVYLFDRKELSVRSMVKQRTSFRDQIVRDVLAE
ncbi:MAG: hypothetical protein ACOX6T_06970 [Myxococcales bacterium]|jgi:hypothetical protein